MRWIAVVLTIAACGAEPKQPFLANAPHPDNAAVAGVAAGAAAAAVIADPDAATRGKPEKKTSDEEKAPVEVKEQVPAGVFDRLEQKPAAPAAGNDGSAAPIAKPAAAAKHKGPAPKIPLPSEAAKRQEDH